MKKYVVILLMLVYGLPSTGASLHLHFCCGKLDDVSFSLKHKPGCKKEGSDNKACCNNVALDLKIDADQQPLIKSMPVFNHAPATAPVYPSWQAALPAMQVLAANKAHAPPPISALIPVYLKKCVFRI